MKKILVIGKEGRLAKYAPHWANIGEYEITYTAADSGDEEILQCGTDFDFMLVDAMARVSKNVIDKMTNLKLIHSEGVGYNYFDVDAARERKVYVCNCKAANAMAVAEHSVLLILGLLRDINRGQTRFLMGEQIQIKEEHMLSGDLRELSQCTVGLLGFGDIARACAGLLQAFGARVIYHNRTRREELEEKYRVTYVTKEKLLEESDIIGVFLNSNEQTYHTVNKDFLDKMKKGAFLVNTARGDLVDSRALLASLEEGHLAGAGLDTVEGEPVSSENPFLTCSKEVQSKIIFSPHIGGITGGAFQRCHEMFWNNIKKVEKGQRPDNVINGL